MLADIDVVSSYSRVDAEHHRERGLRSDHFRAIADLDGMNTVMPVPRILIADDQEEMVGTIAQALANEFDIIGTAQDGKRAVELATQLFPDILILDISMPLVNGIEAAWRLKRLASPTRIIFVTVHSDPDFVEAARSAGALGYVWKESVASDLAPAVRAVLQGNRFTSPSMPFH